MISSGALPKVTFIRPPIPGPDRAASSSVARPISAAVGMIPSAEVKKTSASLAFASVEHDRDRDERHEQVGPPLRADEEARVERRHAVLGGHPVQPIRRRDLDSARVRTRPFGDTDLEVSEIGFGTWALGSSWWGDVPESAGERLLNEALELGITFFETGDAYGQGANEELVGRVLAPHRDRDPALDQVRVRPGARSPASTPRASVPSAGTAPFVREALEASLRRLGTDRVDLYQLHNPRMDAIDSDDCFAALEELRDEGKIRHYGVALGPAIGWREEGLRAIATRDIASVQTVYNLLEQDPGRDLMAAAAEHGVGVMARVPTSSGLLDDNLTPETTFGPGDHRRHRPREWLVEGLQKIDRTPIPLRGRLRPDDGPGGAAVHPRAAADGGRDPHDHQRGRAARVRGREPTSPT